MDSALPEAASENATGFRSILNVTVIVAALGYFVDMFDITLYGVVRIASLTSLGITDPAELLSKGVFLHNMGTIGMILGGILWGIIGDKVGRLSILFGSILLYSVGNLLSAFVGSIDHYAILRFFVGVGLAGELGAAVTLVSEVLPKETRGWATTVIATLGLLGAVAASLFGQLLDWRVAYFIGGVMGLLLLVARFKTFESGMFDKVKHSSIRRGDVMMLFTKERFPKYLGCVLMGVPIYFCTGLLMSYAPELTKDLNITGPVTAGNALLFGTIGLTIGDLASGILSQVLKSRRQAIGVFLTGGVTFALAYSQANGVSPEFFYAICFGLGLFAGYWAVLVTVAAEQFGTNVRATVATTVPNFVRGMVVVITLSFTSLKPLFGSLQSALAIGGVSFAFAFLSVFLLPETYAKDLNYVE
jgi:MFS family permease